MSRPISLVVVAYDLMRELPRTLRSLSPDYQQDIDGRDYEVVIVDNGSPQPLDERMIAEFPGTIRLERLESAPPSPARAANIGLRLAQGELVGLLIDGARLASPGLLAQARLAARVTERAVVATLGWHLGSVPHMRASEVGYDQATEDRLLAETEWERDGYRLFGISTFAGSSQRGFFGPLGESNALFMPSALWTELGGLDERFTTPGGGRVNHDLLRRACELDGARLLVLLGEGTFHQYHDGIATSRRYARGEWEAEYERLRGEPFRPAVTDPIYVGVMRAEMLPHLERSLQWALATRHATDVTPSASESLPD